MKLEKFKKNKKIRNTLLTLGIILVILGGGIIVYRTYALYQDKHKYNVIEGLVPEFITGDVTLAFTIENEKTNIPFPNKGEGYKVKNVTCEDEVTADFDNETWSLTNITNPKSAPRIKCTINFNKYEEEILNGAIPVLKENLIPVTIDESGNVYRANTNEKWYSYENKKWANAVILEDGIAEPEVGKQILEKDIESYFVWIPKYSYQLWDLGNYTNLTEIDETKPLTIPIRFGTSNTTDDKAGECTTPMSEDKTQGLSGETGSCNVGDYMTHPAFISFGVNGLWVGKFETGYKDADSVLDAQNISNTNKVDLSNIVIKPNVYSWRNINTKYAFKNSYEYKRVLDSHMMKNTEWGVVAYLTNSIYGRCSDSTCEEVKMNNNSNNITGYSAVNSTEQVAVEPTKDATNSVNYFNNDSVKASTTGNYTGIYDMAGGAWEYVAGVMTNANSATEVSLENIDFSESELTKEEIADKKYIDLYTVGTMYQYNRRILGDATGEVIPYDKNANVFVHSPKTWFERGGKYNIIVATIFHYVRYTGINLGNDSFRIVLAPKQG